MARAPVKKKRAAKGKAKPKPVRRAPAREKKLAAELKKAKSELKKAKSARKTAETKEQKMKIALAKSKAGRKKLQAQEDRRKERGRRRKERDAEGVTKSRTFKTQIGKTTHISATEIEGEPQYVWKELEERAASKLVRTKPGRPRRWARLVVELSKGSILFPKQYRRLRGAPVIRTSWHPAHELIGKAASVMHNLQQSGAVVPRAKIVVVESKKRPPGRVF